jgi:hypothetical protein
MSEEKKTDDFNLQQWASKEKYLVSPLNRERFSGLVQGRIEGFNKAFDLLMAKLNSRQQLYFYGSEIEQHIADIKGEK